MKTIQVKDATHKELSKVKGYLTSEAGRTISYDETVAGLISFWKKQTGKE